MVQWFVKNMVSRIGFNGYKTVKLLNYRPDFNIWIKMIRC